MSTHEILTKVKMRHFVKIGALKDTKYFFKLTDFFEENDLIDIKYLLKIFGNRSIFDFVYAIESQNNRTINEKKPIIEHLSVDDKVSELVYLRQKLFFHSFFLIFHAFILFFHSTDCIFKKKEYFTMLMPTILNFFCYDVIEERTFDSIKANFLFDLGRIDYKYAIVGARDKNDRNKIMNLKFLHWKNHIIYMTKNMNEKLFDFIVNDYIHNDFIIEKEFKNDRIIEYKAEHYKHKPGFIIYEEKQEKSGLFGFLSKLFG